MRALWGFLAVIWVTAFFSGRALFDVSAAVTGAAAANRQQSGKYLRTTASEITHTDPSRPQPRFDIYGNPIDSAIGDYRVDERGEMFEWHAPDTAVLKLSSPGA